MSDIEQWRESKWSCIEEELHKGYNAAVDKRRLALVQINTELYDDTTTEKHKTALLRVDIEFYNEITACRKRYDDQLMDIELEYQRQKNQQRKQQQ